MIFYKSYTYAPRATLISALFSLLSLMCAIIGIMLFVQSINDKAIPGCVLGAIIALAAIPAYIFGSVRLSKKIAEKDGKKNIMTKARYALMFVRQHPEAYDMLAKENADFAAKYVKDQNGKIVKR